MVEWLCNTEHRTTSLNAQFIILFSNPRDRTQITHLAKQVNPTDVKFVIDAIGLYKIQMNESDTGTLMSKVICLVQKHLMIHMNT